MLLQWGFEPWTGGTRLYGEKILKNFLFKNRANRKLSWQLIEIWTVYRMMNIRSKNISWSKNDLEKRKFVVGLELTVLLHVRERLFWTSEEAFQKHSWYKNIFLSRVSRCKIFQNLPQSAQRWTFFISNAVENTRNVFSKTGFLLKKWIGRKYRVCIWMHANIQRWASNPLEDRRDNIHLSSHYALILYCVFQTSPNPFW